LKTLIPLILLLNVVSSFSADKITISIPSESMRSNFNATVVIPKEYHSYNNKYSVIYLLHGYSGNYSTWSQISPLKEYADTYRLIFVCPDGNFNSWYLNTPFAAKRQFETYISCEVIQFIDKNYRTWTAANGRAIIGSSMGGHGATTLCAKHPDLYCGAGSISGIMDLTEFPGEWDIAGVLGEYKKNAALWKSNSFFSLLEKLAGKNKAIIIDCGTSDFALAGNRKTHEKLLSLGIPHEYYERPGGHTAFYAQKALEIHVKYFSGILAKPGK
jgi:S-formylglutathione hydrolase FrmB